MSEFPFTNREYSKQILFAFGMLKIKTRPITNISNFSFVQNIRKFSCSNNNQKGKKKV